MILWICADPVDFFWNLLYVYGQMEGQKISKLSRMALHIW